jgi:hypothetical protein
MTYSPEQYQGNKDSIEAAQRCYYLKTKEMRLAKQKEYDSSHKEQISARKKKDHINKMLQRSALYQRCQDNA